MGFKVPHLAMLITSLTSATVKRAVVVAILMSIAFSGCIKEEQTYCGTTQLYFSYSGNGEGNILSEKINTINVFVFDEDENYIFSKVLNSRGLNNNTSVRLDLEPGRYNIVSVGNMHENSGLTDLQIGRLDSIFIAHPNHLEQERRFVSTMDSLYIAREIIQVDGYYNSKDTMLFQSTHFDVVIEVEGLEYAQSGEISEGNPIRVAMLNLPSSVNFENQSQSKYKVNYIPKAEYDSVTHKMKLYFQILRHSIDDLLQIVIINRDGTIDQEINLKEFVDENEIDVNKQEVIIPMLIKYRSVGIDVTVPDWAIENVDPEFE